ncbi:sensor domain-containing diguanylate cyclase [Sphingomonas sp.]|uniref:sensor domain-containing diguanylate cyclase n=1 Tax=Sphingomonas sp. TaxID=28214 RepID=UPI0017EF963A|nr:sensor domain-containing diguanylate cyclase [Sphingomonas sp.]MBA3511998.1 sensor domain-containing diguanylate cyclase [Sphingomonas sp.]
MKHSRFTKAHEARPSGRAPDRQVYYAALFVGVMSLLMLILEILDHVVADRYYLSVFSWAEMVVEILIIGAIARAGPLALNEMASRRRATEFAHKARIQVEALFEMTDILQSALGYADANSVVRATAAKLMPGLGGALYVFNNSGDRLELSSSWGRPDDGPPLGRISPSQCWAIKRGKPHLNLAVTEALRCEHHDQSSVALEIPMMARGEVYGLLSIHSGDPDAEQRLSAATPVAEALADAMSLALANIALREKLRTQALRDPLTGLYNRRYMEDVLERYSNLAERNQSPLSVVMIDLDHFKTLNDDLGHAEGDAVLCEVSATIAGAIRPCDVACRYGGEELVVLLPDCGTIEALAKAEILRARIERLSENHDARITASFGVATIPDTSPRGIDALADADAALYRAKTEGRNRVAVAGRPEAQPVVDRKSAAKAA